MLPFRSEIRNSPKEQTIKIYVKDTSLDDSIKKMLEKIETIDLVEIQESISRDRVGINITVYRKGEVNINLLKTEIDELLDSFFAVN
jgi:hypothetical protein